MIGLHLIGVVNALSQPWFHLKLTLLFFIFGYQHLLSRFIKQMKKDTFEKSSRWCRIFNEIPLILVTGIVFAVLTKNIGVTMIATGTVFSALLLFFLIKKPT